MFGSEVETDWEPGSRIVWRGKYAGMSYEDHGEILEFEPESRLVMTHFSPLSGAGSTFRRTTTWLRTNSQSWTARRA